MHKKLALLNNKLSRLEVFSREHEKLFGQIQNLEVELVKSFDRLLNKINYDDSKLLPNAEHPE